MTRIIVYTGKGGVGKTSVAAATALLAAERGYRTIVLSTDAAHSLGDAFDRSLGPEPVPIAPNLWGQESEVFHNVEAWDKESATPWRAKLAGGCSLAVWIGVVAMGRALAYA